MNTFSLRACLHLPNRRVRARGLQAPTEATAICGPEAPTGRVFKSPWLQLCLALAVATLACGSLAAEEAPPKSAEAAKAPVKELSGKLTDQQQKAIDFAERYEAARTPRSKHDTLRGVRAVQLRVVLVDAEARENLSKSAVVSAATERLAAAGVKVVESDSAPYLVLSVNTVDCGIVLAFDVRLEFIEEVVLPRADGFLKTVVKSWDTSQFGSASKAVSSDHLAAAVLAVLKRLTAGLAESK